VLRGSGLVGVCFLSLVANNKHKHSGYARQGGEGEDPLRSLESERTVPTSRRRILVGVGEEADGRVEESWRASAFFALLSRREKEGQKCRLAKEMGTMFALTKKEESKC
jgi:hypothetical protein